MNQREHKAQMAARERNERNLNPHAEAIAAMTVWGYEYAKQSGGSMDFYDGLPDSRKRLCRELVSNIKAAHRDPHQ